MIIHLLNFFVEAGTNLHKILELRRYDKLVRARYYSIYRKTVGLPSSLAKEDSKLKSKIKDLERQIRILESDKELPPNSNSNLNTIKADQINYIKFIGDHGGIYFTKNKIYKIVNYTDYKHRKSVFIQVISDTNYEFTIKLFDEYGNYHPYYKKRFIGLTESEYQLQINNNDDEDKLSIFIKGLKMKGYIINIYDNHYGFREFEIEYLDKKERFEIVWDYYTYQEETIKLFNKAISRIKNSINKNKHQSCLEANDSSLQSYLNYLNTIGYNIHITDKNYITNYRTVTMFYKGYRVSRSITNYINDSEIIKLLKELEKNIQDQVKPNVSLLSHVGIKLNNPYMCAEIKPYS